MDIQVIPHGEIDKVKWNSCVHYATNGNVFGYKWYLDAVAKEWDGLVEGDYESVMPLFVTEKPTLLEQPALLREAGIYSIHLLSQARTISFLEAIPAQYSDVLIQFNEGIQIAEDSDYEVTLLKNYQLVLLDDYETLVDKYAAKLRTQRKSPDRKLLLPSSNVKPEKIAQLFKENAPATRENEIAFHTYQRIMYNALHRGWGATFGVTDLQKNLLSAAFFIYAQGRVMQLVSASSPKGKKLGAYEYLMDNFIQSHAGRPMVLDFNTTSEEAELFGAKANHFSRLEKGSKIVKPTLKKSWKFW